MSVNKYTDDDDESYNMGDEYPSIFKTTLFNLERGHKRGNGRFIGHWSRNQEAAYFKFVILNRDDFQTIYSRKTQKIYKRMSKQIKSRNAIQCKTHHQKKLIKYNNNLDRLINDGRYYCFGGLSDHLLSQLQIDVQQSNTKTFYRIFQKKGRIKIVIQQKYMKCYQQ